MTLYKFNYYTPFKTGPGTHKPIPRRPGVGFIPGLVVDALNT